MLKYFKKFLSLKQFHVLYSLFFPWLIAAFLICFCYGTLFGLFIVPADYQQGDGFRIIYVHVPSAFAAMLIYFIMAFCAFITLVWRIKIFSIVMSASASIGAWFAVLTLITGSLWGKPMWGTYWIWDARLTSMLILLFLYLGFLALHSSILNHSYREKACALLALTGVINLPVIHYSVIWWNTLHQGPSLAAFSTPSIAPVMLYPLLGMIIAFFLFYLIILFIKIRTQILLRG